MFKRVTIVALVVAAFLVLAVPAMAFNGYRGDYTTTPACQACHADIAGIPSVYHEWAETKHAETGIDGQGARLPYGSVCGGCHVSNYDPTKVVPTPTATSSTGAVSWGDPRTPELPMGDPANTAPYSETGVGCSSCHYGANVAGGLDIYGVDPNDTAHTAPDGARANPDICGQCHSRYAYTVDVFDVAAVPYTTVTTPLPGDPITPNPSPTTQIQPQMALGYPMLGSPAPSPATGWDPAAPLSDYLNIPTPGWTPMPTATAAGFAKLQTFWQVDGVDTPWQQVGHDGSAAQYPEWANEGHANALTGLTSKTFWGFLPESTKQECLECHSTDFRINKEQGNNPQSADAQYGVTCVGCHTPHDKGTVKGVWWDNLDAQLIGDTRDMCTDCHNGEIPEGTEASPGAEIHHPMKEMMDGYGAIGVSAFPSVHKGKCIQCHMAPTAYNGSLARVQRAGNHTFKIIEPEVAAAASPITVSASPSPITKGMPYSACSTCHAAPPAPGATPDPHATYLQPTIDQRQEWTKAKIDAIWAALDVAADNLGYADRDEAHEALVAKPSNTWTTAERAFLSSFTNVGFVQSEGSFGLHNWDYSREIVNTAMMQAKVAQTGVVVKLPWKVTFAMSKSSINAGTSVKFSGTVKTSKGVAGVGKVKIMKRVGGVWKVWQSVSLKANGSYSLTKKMTTKGSFWMRALMPTDSLNLQGVSTPNKKLVVK